MECHSAIKTYTIDICNDMDESQKRWMRDFTEAYHMITFIRVYRVGKNKIRIVCVSGELVQWFTVKRHADILGGDGDILYLDWLHRCMHLWELVKWNANYLCTSLLVNFILKETKLRLEVILHTLRSL